MNHNLHIFWTISKNQISNLSLHKPLHVTTWRGQFQGHSARPGARIAWLGGHENFIYLNSRVWINWRKCSTRSFTNSEVKTTKKEKKRSSSQKIREFPQILVFIPKNVPISTNSEVKTKKGLRPKIYANFHESCGAATKQLVFIAKSTKKQFLLTSFRVMTSILASNCTPVAPSLLISSGHKPRLRMHNSRLGGHKHWFGRHDSEIPPVALGLHSPRATQLLSKKCHGGG